MVSGTPPIRAGRRYYADPRASIDGCCPAGSREVVSSARLDDWTGLKPPQLDAVGQGADAGAAPRAGAAAGRCVVRGSGTVPGYRREPGLPIRDRPGAGCASRNEFDPDFDASERQAVGIRGLVPRHAPGRAPDLHGQDDGMEL